MSRPGSPALDEAQEPAWARSGTHVLLPRLAYYELANLLRDAEAAVSEALELPSKASLRGLPERLRAAVEDAARHARNSGVY